MNAEKPVVIPRLLLKGVYCWKKLCIHEQLSMAFFPVTVPKSLSLFVTFALYPWRACAARVTIRGPYFCLCVCLCLFPCYG